jgi:DNA segregation ATPase FtsK/SpoIIIE, S-DNA-T family
MSLQTRLQTGEESRERVSSSVPSPGPEAEAIRKERLALRQLLERIAERVEVEPSIDEDFESRNSKANRAFDATFQEIIVRFAAEKEAVQRDISESRNRIESTYKEERAALEAEFASRRKRFLLEYEDNKQAAKNEFQESRWAVSALYEGAKASAENEHQNVHQKMTAATERLQSVDKQTRQYLEECRLATGHSDDMPPASDQKQTPLVSQVLEATKLAEDKLNELRALTVPRAFRREFLLWSCSLLVIAVVGVVLFLQGTVWILTLSAVAILLAVATGVRFWLHSLALKQVGRICSPLYRALGEAQSLSRRCRAQAAITYRKKRKEAKKRFFSDTRQAVEHYRQVRKEQKERKALVRSEMNQEYRQRNRASKDRRKRDWQETVGRYRLLRTEVQARFDTDARRARQQRDRALDESSQTREQEWRWTVTAWRDGLSQFASQATALANEDRRNFPAWDSPTWENWTPAASLLPVVRFGSFHVDLEQIENGLPKHERLQSDLPTQFSLPALITFPENFALLVKATGEGRPHADQLLQTVMFRLLTAIPPSKVRFTIVDPIGLGQNFASFMHLADYDEALVGSRIWTESVRIEQRLADLTDHMETVIQKYLRNQFETIDEYNLHAGEVAEPYRVLVVANFPANFTFESARRLLSIIHSGPRCGVYTLISVDSKQPLMPGFDLKDLERGGVQLVWDNGRFVWQDPDFASYPLSLDAPPPEDLSTRILKQIGAQAKEAKRVEVPFGFVAPPPSEWWTADSRRGIHVPLGRVGATKRQYLSLGQGTAQHVLIAGKTGSGKSSLLHALVNNLALLYSPLDLELYLVDFKKGVEFKTYATHDLPHARVVAIESEREFGLSVLQRLDLELRTRADKFRAVGAQDLPTYRQLSASAVMPRILLIVDEFQEFFVEDDKLAQEAALLLDRLVRQGRAFGLHVLLGSQTLGGAYSLARSTIDQMAVRIALQCSEADAHLILSEDNAAARLLSRPGEAIYNDANGLVEGNNPFQVVWLSDEKREDYLAQVQELARTRGIERSAPQIVFEGNAPADIHKNHVLKRLLESYPGQHWDRPAHAWLGEAIAIKDATAAVFRNYAASNLLIVGQFDEPVLAMAATAMISLAATNGNTQAEGGLYVLDGTLEDSSHAGYLARIAGCLPTGAQIGGYRDGARLIGAVGQEVERRMAAGNKDAAGMFLIIHGMQRFRDLRRTEDDFSFSARSDQPANPSQQFATILREGPLVGVHTLVWCDSYNNLTRFVDRQALREFDLRVLFQMSANDSSNLIDSPLAAKLGMHRAYFQSEEQGRLEKFRPYGLPDEQWLQWVKIQFAKPATSLKSEKA